MKTEWRGEVRDVRECKVDPGYIKEKDLILIGSEVLEVITIQRDCPRLENLSKVFTQFTLQARDGTIIPTRDLQGKQIVYKKNRRLIHV